MSADETTGVDVVYQGYACGTAFHWETQDGLEPARGYVTVPVRDFKTWTLRESLEGVDGLTVSRGSQTGFASSGTLSFKESAPDGTPYEVKYERVLITEDGVEVTGVSDSPEGAIARVHLSDLRYLWARRGYITELGSVNILPQGFGQDADNLAALQNDAQVAASAAAGLQALLDYLQTGGGAQIIEGTGGVTLFGTAAGGTPLREDLDRRFQAGDFGPISQAFGDKVFDIINSGTIPQLLDYVANQQADAAKKVSSANQTLSGAFLPLSLRDARVPWNLRQALEEIVLPNLPGAPILRRLPKDLENALPLNHTWDCILAKQALADLLEEFNLILALNPDTTVSLYHPGERGLELDAGDFDGKPIPTDDASVFDTEELAEAKKIMVNRWTPAVVVVKGPQVHMTALAALEPCGELRGRVVSLKEFLAGLGLDDKTGRRFVFLTEPERFALGVSYEGIEQFTRCAWKWWRLAPEVADIFLPILDRGLVESNGQTLPPRVLSERAIVANLPLMKKLTGKDNVRKKLQGTIDEARRLIIERDEEDAAKAVKQAAALVAKARGGGTSSDGSNKVETGATPGVAEIRADFAEITKRRAEAHKRVVEQLKDVGNYAALVNLDYGVIDSGYTIDRERGIVMFNAVQGLVDPEGSSVEVAQLQREDARVALEFGYAKHAGGKSPASIGDRYFSVWQRVVAGAGGAVTVKKLAAIPKSSGGIEAAVAMIDRPDLLQVVARDSTTNKAKLDEIAQRAAVERLRLPSGQLGGEYKFGRPMQIIITGRCRWISHGLESDGRPYTRARLEATGPVPPRPDFSTFAKPRQGAGKAHQNVQAPRSTRRDGP